MSKIKWTYDLMYKYYTKQHIIEEEDINNDIISIVYESKKTLKKDKTKLEPFIKQNIKYVGLSPIQNKDKFPLGLYMVYDDNSSGKKWLYLVSPDYISCLEHKNSFLAANHFTFCEDPTDKKKPCHFHKTNYLCYFDKKEDKELYRCDHEKDHFNTKLTIPDDEPNILLKNQGVKETLLDIMKYPWVQHEGGSGGKKKKRQKQEARLIQNQRFCDLWTENGFKSLKGFGVKQDNMYHWTVCIIEKGRLLESRVYPAYVFTTNVGDDHEAIMQDYIVQKI